MQRTDFSEFACSVARTMNIVGEPWSPLILRDIFLGVTRFDKIQEDLGIPRKVLAERLSTMVDQGVLERVPYRNGRMRFEYVMTDKGRDFLTSLIALMNWGDRWQSGPEGVPVQAIHTGCGGDVEAKLICTCCGEPVNSGTVHGQAGPGARTGKGTAFLGRFPNTAPTDQIQRQPNG
jgi:DNA-binding HxlR family transcriptional regulator